MIQISKADNFNREIKVIVSVAPQGLELNIDREQIEQALINLLKNAEQALADKSDGEIKLTASLNQRGRIVIDVCDNGPSIKDGIMDKIFVPYFTTKPDGSGIGLSLTRQIMAHHGGFIRVMNLEEGGASFKLTF